MAQTINTICRGIPDARWTTQHNLHLTLKFIGHVDAHTAERINNVLKSVNSQPFELHCRSLGQFTHHDAAALWLGIDAHPRLSALQTEVTQRLSNVLNVNEEATFTPHITLARCRHKESDAYGDYFRKYKDFDAGMFAVNAFHLYSSRSDEKGPHYQIEETYPLREKS